MGEGVTNLGVQRRPLESEKAGEQFRCSTFSSKQPCQHVDLPQEINFGHLTSRTIKKNKAVVICHRCDRKHAPFSCLELFSQLPHAAMSSRFKETTVSLSLQNSKTIFASLPWTILPAPRMCASEGEGRGQLFLWVRKRRKATLVGLANFNHGLHTWALVVSQGRDKGLLDQVKVRVRTE